MAYWRLNASTCLSVISAILSGSFFTCLGLEELHSNRATVTTSQILVYTINSTLAKRLKTVILRKLRRTVPLDEVGQKIDNWLNESFYLSVVVEVCIWVKNFNAPYAKINWKSNLVTIIPYHGCVNGIYVLEPFSLGSFDETLHVLWPTNTWFQLRSVEGSEFSL